MQQLVKWLFSLTVTFGFAFLAMLFMSANANIGPDAQGTLQNLAVLLLVLTMVLIVLTASLSSYVRDQNRISRAERSVPARRITAQDDARLEAILHKLPPQDRAYIRQRLAQRNLGVGNDGELVTLDDLLSDADTPKEKRQTRR